MEEEKLDSSDNNQKSNDENQKEEQNKIEKQNEEPVVSNKKELSRAGQIVKAEVENELMKFQGLKKEDLI